MVCKNCKSSWTSIVQMDTCPFCGKSLKEIEEEPTDISSAIRLIVKERGLDVLRNYKLMVSLISDYVQGYEREKKLFKIVGSNGVLEQIRRICNESNSGQQQLLVQKSKSILMDEAFLSEENAVLILNIIFIGVGLPEIKTTQVEGVTIKKPINNPPLPSANPTTVTGFQCLVCGYTTDRHVEDACPMCNAPADRYNKFTKNQSSPDEQLFDIINRKAKPSKSEGEEMTKRGRELLQSGTKDKAIMLIKYAAQHGIHEAAILLGDCYNQGDGVPKDWKIAEAYYRQAAVSGSHEAEYKIGILLVVNNGWNANSWLKKAADSGYKPAIDYLRAHK